MATSLTSLLEHCDVMAGTERDEALRDLWAVMANEIREYLGLVDDDALPGL